MTITPPQNFGARILTLPGGATSFSVSYNSIITALGYIPAATSGSTFFGPVGLNAGGSFGGAFTSLSGTVLNARTPPLTGSTDALPGAVTVNITLSGVIGNTSGSNPPYQIIDYTIFDTLSIVCGAAPVAFNLQQNVNGGGGGRSMIHSVLNLNSITTGSIHNQYGAGINGWLTVNAPLCGSTVGSPKGVLFGGGTDKLFLSPGATNYSAGVASKEIDCAVSPSSTSLTLTGSIIGGETAYLQFSSVTGGFNLTASYTTVSGDQIPNVVNNLGAYIINDPTMDSYELGVGLPGASTPGTGANVLGLSWPVRWSDMNIVFAVSGATAMSGTIATPYVSGASILNRFYLSMISLAKDGSSPYGLSYQYDGFFLFNKQSRANGWNQGAPKTIFVIGGQGAGPNATMDFDSPIFNSQWPLDRAAIWFYPVAPTTTGGKSDGPLTQPESAAVIAASGVVFTRGGIGPFDFSGWRVWGDGAQTIGGTQITRLQGDTGVAGIKISATGWEAKSFVVSNAGGSPALQPFIGRYFDKELFTTAFGGQFTVNGVTSTGGIAGALFVTDGNGHTNYPCTPQIAMPPTVLDVLTGSGINAQITVVWTPARDIRLGGADNRIIIDQGSAPNAGTYLISNFGFCTANGTTQAGATTLPNQLSIVTGGASGQGILAPSGTAGGSSLIGAEQTILNKTGNPLKLWPVSGAQFDSAGANNFIAVAVSGVTRVIYTTSGQAYIY